jgi:glucokinase
VARAAFDRAGELIGLGVASAVALLDPDVVIIGGGLTQAGSLLVEPLLRGFQRNARLSFAGHIRVLPAALGPAAGLVGAAALLLRADRYQIADPCSGPEAGGEGRCPVPGPPRGQAR